MFEASTLGDGGDTTFAGDMETMEGIDWGSIINQGFGIGSQAIQAFSGAHGGTQIGYNASQGVFAIQPSHPQTYSEYPANYAVPQQGYTPQQIAAMQQAGVGGTVGSGVDGIFNWLMQNPVITFGGIAAVYLLFKEPPRRR